MRLRHLQALRPGDPKELQVLVKKLWGLCIVDGVLADQSTAPLAYLSHTFFEQEPGALDERASSRDCVVWANRGGGKTMLGAVATLLDLIFKPGIEVRVLGGSLEQASKMHAHLLRLLDHDAMRGVLATAPTARRVILDNGSRVEILAGSQRSVRGVRVHKLRCDEVEELDPAIWAAAQLTTRSGWCGDVFVHGAVEAMSTMHRPFGLMARLIDGQDSGSVDSQPIAEHRMVRNEAQITKRFVWNAIDVAEPCPTALPCEGCVLWNDCRGRAKHARGFIPIADLMQQWRRSSSLTWAAEMMCERPGVAHAVYSSFDAGRHVDAFEHEGVEFAAASRDKSQWVAGMDFGLRCPTVMLWGYVEGEGAESLLKIVAEYDATDRTLSDNLDAIKSLQSKQHLPEPHCLRWLAIDPAGNARNAHSGQSDAAVLREHGYRVRSRSAGIEQGIEAVRRRLDHGRLRIDPRCTKLIAALQSYHFDAQRPQQSLPVKDGPDHWCDALRYLVMTLDQSFRTARGGY